MGPPTLRYQGLDGATHSPVPRKCGWPLVCGFVREFLLLTAPSGLLCGNWDFSSSFSRRCSHGYQMQVKSSSIAALLTIVKPSGSLHPRVQKAGPEHFGIVAVDCAKARSKWMLADFYGRILIPPSVVEHNKQGFDSAIAEIRRVMESHSLGDMLVAIERTGIYHLPVKRNTVQRLLPKRTTTEDEARITHLHTRNRPCSRVLRRHSGHAFPTILAAFSVVEKESLLSA